MTHDLPTTSSSAVKTRFITHHEHLRRPFSWFHPTLAEFHHEHNPEISESPQVTQSIQPFQPIASPALKIYSKWNSRASRKRRYPPKPIQVCYLSGSWSGERISDGAQSNSGPSPPLGETKGRSPRSPSNGWMVTEQRLKHPSSELKVHLAWDISFWVAIVFILGSTAWIVNGFYLFLPLLDIAGDHSIAASWWGFAGGTLFEIGSYLMYVESLNTGHERLFGPTLWGLITRKSDDDQDSELDEKESGLKKHKFRWIGLGSPRDLGFLACFIQLWSASIFWISTITGLPHVIPNLATSPPVAIADVFFWSPQVVGGTGFIIASILFMEEVQKSWWRVNITSFGWHVGFWNLIGAIGFTLCGALGYGALYSSKVNYQSVLATFWGAFAFEIGSVVQLCETLWREPPDEQ